MGQASTVEEQTDRCVLWVAQGWAPPAPLLESLARRQVATRVCDDPLMALARACRLQRDHAAGARLLVVCDPPRLPGPTAFVEHMNRYAPGIAVWCYEEGISPNLRPLSPEHLERWSTPSHIHAGVKSPLRTPSSAPSPSTPKAPHTPTTPTIPSLPPPRPTLRLVEGPAIEAPVRLAPPALTPDELAMLLGEVPLTADGAPPRTGPTL